MQRTINLVEESCCFGIEIKGNTLQDDEALNIEFVFFFIIVCSKKITLSNNTFEDLLEITPQILISGKF